MMIPAQVIKRDGRITEFDQFRIENAIHKCLKANREDGLLSGYIANQVVNVVSARYQNTIPTVEQIQDAVEMMLLASGKYEVAKSYILYRAEHAKMREVRPIPEEVRRAFEESERYFRTPLQQFQFYDKYSRFNYDLGRRETWTETVDRAVSFLFELSGGALDSSVYEEIRQAILSMQAMPSMRLLAMAGEAARRDNATIYNCSYLATDSVDSFVEALLISMAGCGVGFSVERQYVEQLPRIRRQRDVSSIQWTIEDTAQGWADALRLGLESWFDGYDVVFDYSLIRPAGAPLRTKGGRASGPEPLRIALNFARARILSRQGSALRSLDAHDLMCVIGNAAISGGVRRMAMISLFDYDDVEMRQCKSGEFEKENSQRWNANNSVVWNHDLTQEEFIGHFMEMVTARRGEPGIFSRQNARLTKPLRRSDADFGANPCVTGDTWVLTSQGAKRVDSLIGVQHFALINGRKHLTTEDGFWETGIKPVMLLRTVEGHCLELTSNHQVLCVSKLTRYEEETEWKEAGQLCPGDKIKLHNHSEVVWNGTGNFDEGWLLGSLLGDETIISEKIAKIEYWGEHRLVMGSSALERLRANVKHRSDLAGCDLDGKGRFVITSTGLLDLAQKYGMIRWNKVLTPDVERSSSDFYCGFLQGFFDADGTIIGDQSKGVSVRLSQVNLQNLEAVQRMLLRLGIGSQIYKYRKNSGYRLMPDGKGGSAEYWCQDNHELVISGANLQTFANKVGFSKPDKKEKLANKLNDYKRKLNKERFVATVESVTPNGNKPVYDCCVPGVSAFDANGIYVHNCTEIHLLKNQFCNLSIAIARVYDTFVSVAEKVRIATIIGTIQSMATRFPGLRDTWRQNCEEERLLGVDITGQMDSPIVQDASVLAQLKEIAIKTNQEYAKILEINPSAAITCVKPSGNSSQLLDCSSGLHARHAPYYIRNVRVSAHSPVFKVLRDAGAPMNPENGQAEENANTWVVHFPVKAPEGALVRRDMSAVQQCEVWLRNKINWTEHNPSITVTYKPDEILELMQWLWDHKDKIGGMSFLPSDEARYEQMPYVEITQEEYEKLMREFPEVDFSKIYRYEEMDLTTAAQELACVSGACEI